jgi:hypothetical protein
VDEDVTDLPDEISECFVLPYEQRDRDLNKVRDYKRKYAHLTSFTPFYE